MSMEIIPKSDKIYPTYKLTNQTHTITPPPRQCPGALKFFRNEDDTRRPQHDNFQLVKLLSSSGEDFKVQTTETNQHELDRQT